jgi:hypothetical protein
MTPSVPLLIAVAALFAVATLIIAVAAVGARRMRARTAAICLGLTGWTAWLLAPAWAAATFSSLACAPAATLAVLGLARRRAAAGERQLLLDRLLRVCEQPLALAADVARLRVYAEAAALAARCEPIPLPAPPEDDRPGGDEVWNALTGTWEAVRAAGELRRTGLASRRPYRRACRALARQAAELAELLERDDAAGYLPPRPAHTERASADGPASLLALVPGPEQKGGHRG